MSKDRIIYKVFPHDDVDVRQQTTSVNTKDVPSPYYWNHVEEVIRERFKEYDINFNHAGKTIGLYRIGEMY